MPYVQSEYSSGLSQRTTTKPLCVTNPNTFTGADKRPVKKVRAARDKFESIHIDGDIQLVVGFNIVQPKLEENEDIVSYEPVVETALAVKTFPKSWKPTRKFAKEVESQVQKFNDFIGREKHDVVDYMILSKQLQSDPTYNHYLDLVGFAWKHIHNRFSEKESHDDIEIFDRTSIIKSSLILEAKKVNKFLSGRRKDYKKARKEARKRLQSIGFQYSRPKLQPLVKPIPEVVPLSTEKVSIDTEHLFNKSVSTEKEMSFSTNSPIDYISTPDVNLEVHSLNSVEKVEEDIVRCDLATENCSIIVPISLEKIEEKPIELYNNIPGVVIKRGQAANNVIPMISSCLNINPTKDLVNSVTQEKSENLSVVSSHPLLIQNRKRKHSDRKHCDIPTKLGYQPSDFFISSNEAIDAVYDDAYNTSVPYSPIVIHLSDSDEYSDDHIIICEEISRTLQCTRWKMKPIDIPLFPRNLHLKRGLPAVTEEYRQNQKNKKFPDDVFKSLEDYVYVPVIPTEPVKHEKQNAIYKQLGLRDMNIRKCRIYKFHNGFSTSEQQTYNQQNTLSEFERHNSKIIPNYGNLQINCFSFPFTTDELYAGLYWPIMQPIDGIVVKDNNIAVENADVQNQLVNQTVCNYFTQKYLLCDSSSDYWDTEYKTACMHEEGQNIPGRFKNRIGYARVFDKESYDEVKMREKAKDEERRRELKEYFDKQKKDFFAKNGLAEDEDVPGAFLTEYTNVCLSRNLNENLRRQQRDVFSKNSTDYYSDQGKRCENKYMKHWFEVEIQCYVPANDRRGFLCTYVNHHNNLIVRKFFQNIKVLDYGNPPIEKVAPIIADAFTAAFAFQHTKTFMLLNHDHLQLAVERLQNLTNQVSDGSTVSLQSLLAMCKMEEWEWNYWPLIWDSLAAIYKILPPISQIMPYIHSYVDEAYKKVVVLDNRLDYYDHYLLVSKHAKRKKNAD